MRVYPDACVLIYLIEKHPELHPQIETAIRQTPRLSFALSELLRLECRVSPMRQGNFALLAKFDHFFSSSMHVFIPASRQVFDLATELRAQHHLKTPDALHLASAIHAGCDSFWTNDRHLEKAAHGKIKLLTFN